MCRATLIREPNLRTLPITLSLVLPGCGMSGSCPTETGLRGSAQVPRADYEAALADDGTLSDEACTWLCERFLFANEVDRVTSCELVTAPTDTAGDATLSCGYDGIAPCKGGRGHSRVWVPRPGPGRASVARWLAEAASAEAASVLAFNALARELASHRAPDELVARCHRSAAEEILHARMLGAFAVRLGERPVRPRSVPGATRSIEAIAEENLREGCVGETWGALVARHQASAARDPALRAVFRRIAGDEARHSALAFDLQRWLAPMVGPPMTPLAPAPRVGDGAHARAELGLPGPSAERRLRRRVASRVRKALRPQARMGL